jgi:TolA-binding protein
MDSLQRAIGEARAEYDADPEEAGKLMKLIEALRRTEQAEFENQGIEVLEKAYARTKQFRFRQQIGEIKLMQLSRMERSMRADVEANLKDQEIKDRYRQFVREKLDEELKEYTLWSENYPSDQKFRYEMAARLFRLEKYQQAIPVLQQVRSDPKYRIVAGILLGRAFLGDGFVDEAVDTLESIVKEYQFLGDQKSIEMNYYYGRALEQKGDKEGANHAYSRVAQWDFNYRDVQQRIKRLRSSTLNPEP